MARKKHIIPPSFQDEQDLLETIDNVPEIAEIRGKSFRFRMLTGFAQHKISQIMIGSGDSLKDTCKCVSAAWLNGYFSLKFLYCIVWRWFYYIRQYNEAELSDAVELIKKKIPSTQYFTNTIFLIGMRETTMAMNKNEVYLTLRERSGDKDGNSAKKDNGSQNPSKS